MIARDGAHSVDADSQTDHIELILREPLYTGRIEDMVHRPVAHSLRKRIRILLEKAYLAKGEIIT